MSLETEDLKVERSSRHLPTRSKPLEDLSFSRASRLFKRSDFSKVFASVRSPETGRLIRTRNCIIYQRKTDAPARLGISISKKVIRSASQRNRTKRCIREFFRQEKQNLDGDILVRWTKAPRDFEFSTLTAALRKVRAKK